MGHHKKQEIVTFKVDETLSVILKNMPNRSDFIRTAILSALENMCPLCLGTGILTADQRRHYDFFIRDHSLQECSDCHAQYFVCSARNERDSFSEQSVQHSEVAKR